MTEEQIKQNAEAYADVFGRHMVDYYGVKDAFIAGAHSRDEEITRLSVEIEDDDYVISKLREELNKLRNQWRDAKTDPPKRKIGNKICYTFLDTAFNGVNEQRYYHFAEYKKYDFGKKGWLDEDGNLVLVEIADYWMPILETPKGGER